MKRGKLISGTADQLNQIARFCRTVYHTAFGPEEGDARLRQLTALDAVALWREGLPESAHTP